MKRRIKLTENQLYNIVNESVRRIIAEATATKDIIWIAYGEEKYDPKKFRPMHDHGKMDYGSDTDAIVMNWEMVNNKPMGCLWACPLNDYNEYDWLDFRGEDNGGRDKNPKFFLFRLSPKAKILTIKDDEDLKKWSTKPTRFGQKMLEFDWFQRCYDGLFMCDINRDGPAGYCNTASWDVPSICIWNKKVIVPIPEEEKHELYRRYKG